MPWTGIRDWKMRCGPRTSPSWSRRGPAFCHVSLRRKWLIVLNELLCQIVEYAKRTIMPNGLLCKMTDFRPIRWSDFQPIKWSDFRPIKWSIFDQSDSRKFSTNQRGRKISTNQMVGFSTNQRAGFFWPIRCSDFFDQSDVRSISIIYIFNIYIYVC